MLRYPAYNRQSWPSRQRLTASYRASDGETPQLEIEDVFDVKQTALALSQYDEFFSYGIPVARHSSKHIRRLLQEESDEDALVEAIYSAAVSDIAVAIKVIRVAKDREYFAKADVSLRDAVRTGTQYTFQCLVSAEDWAELFHQDLVDLPAKPLRSLKRTYASTLEKAQCEVDSFCARYPHHADVATLLTASVWAPYLAVLSLSPEHGSALHERAVHEGFANAWKHGFQFSVSEYASLIREQFGLPAIGVLTGVDYDVRSYAEHCMNRWEAAAQRLIGTSDTAAEKLAVAVASPHSKAG